MVLGRQEGHCIYENAIYAFTCRIIAKGAPDLTPSLAYSYQTSIDLHRDRPNRRRHYPYFTCSLAYQRGHNRPVHPQKKIHVSSIND